ncbi:hypothetical protein FHS31_002757 [Sphingomonas vulcanisoli]|uniref:Glycosyltransferase RgtA/B/C/D-like domain-containing protein n=1 Tax=Sphingomonas vulcanisoli TaxID=1658060 RepID=A0ABX0TXG2_9SPHN|nr:hypothetical protein [Sphingomonas vulcanisoli]NIJ09125.1 hypothetical protein [Sphingomonas vulcanisoli]
MCGAPALLQIFTFRPGILTWDAIRQYKQALSGHYDDWHPPAMNWLWRQLTAIHDGPLPMLVLQVALYWLGFGLIGWVWWRQGRRRSAAALLLVALLPVSLVVVGTILKDSLMAGALLTAAGLIAVRRPGEHVLAAMAWALLIGAATLRFNAVPACLPLGVALLPAAWRAGWKRLALASVTVAIPLFAAMPVANTLLRAEKSGVELSLVIYDLAGITRFSGANAFPQLAVADPVAVNAACYTPVSWDRYAWWGPEPCAIQFADVRRAFAAMQVKPTRWWLGAVVRHPIAYAEHRLAHFNSTTRFLVHDADLPPLPLVSDPNPWGCAVPANAPLTAIEQAATASLRTPIGWPIVWLAVAAGALVLLLGQSETGVALPLAISALLYGFSYLPLSVASEVRYYLWVTLGGAVAAIAALTQARHTSARRLALAGLPVVLVSLGGVAARMI